MMGFAANCAMLYSKTLLRCSKPRCRRRRYFEWIVIPVLSLCRATGRRCGYADQRLLPAVGAVHVSVCDETLNMQYRFVSSRNWNCIRCMALQFHYCKQRGRRAQVPCTPWVLVYSVALARHSE